MGDYVVDNGEIVLDEDIKMRILAFKQFLDNNQNICHFDKAVPSFNINNPEKSIQKWAIKMHFPEVVGETPAEYMRRLKIEKAKKMLEEGASIDDVVNSSGMLKTSFMTVFKRYTGITLLEWQKGRKTRDFIVSIEEFNKIIRIIKSIDEKLLKKESLTEGEWKYWVKNMSLVLEFYRSKLIYWGRRVEDTGLRVRRKVKLTFKS